MLLQARVRLEEREGGLEERMQASAQQQQQAERFRQQQQQRLQEAEDAHSRAAVGGGWDGTVLD